MSTSIFDINNLQGEFRTGKIADDGVLMTPVCRLSYDALYTRTQYQGPNNKPGEVSKPYFGSSLLFNTAHVDRPGLVDISSVLIAYFQQVARDHFASQNKKMPYDQEAGFYGYWDGARKDIDGYGPGIWYVSAKNYSDKISQVPVVDAQGQHVGPTQIKAGDFVRARIRAYVSNNYEHKGVNVQLKAVQLLMPWEGFSAAKEDTGDEFGSVSVPAQAPQPVPMGGSTGRPTW